MLMPSGHATNDPQLPPSPSSQQTDFDSATKLQRSSQKHLKNATAEDAIETNYISPSWGEVERQLEILQNRLKSGWTVHTGKDGRLYYCNHNTQTSGWLPPCENWNQYSELPYGWEQARDSKGRSYFINHLSKTSTYEAPHRVKWDENLPEPRIAVLQRSQHLGFGFVAGSERPVIVRFVTEEGPSINKLQPGDQILAVNGEDVKDAPRDHVIQLVRACESHVSLLVCQPVNSHGAGRKSTLLSAGKRAKLRSRPSRVRFAESVCVNGAPLFPPSAFSLGEICVPPMANVLKVFLENGQTKSFKYDSTTIVQDVVTSLYDKLCLSAVEHFSLVLEHVKSLKRNKLTILDREEPIARIAARPGAHKLRCLFRVTFAPISATNLAKRDLNTLDYLYMQCCNDVTQERFAPELQPEVALRLAALHIYQHAKANNIPLAKLSVKVVEREFGLERFVPSSLIDGMKRKELRRLIAHFLKFNTQINGSSSKILTQLQAKVHYLDIISGLPSYGAKCFSTNQKEGVERVLLVSPRFGLSQIVGVRNSVPQQISAIGDFTRVTVNREDDITCTVCVFMHSDRFVKFSMEDRDASEFSLVLAGYFRLLTGKPLAVNMEREICDEDNAPSYLTHHTVLPADWSYLLPFHNRVHFISFLVSPPYHPVTQLTVTLNNINRSEIALSAIPSPIKSPKDFTGSNMCITAGDQCDRNMNTMTMTNNNHKHSQIMMPNGRAGGQQFPHILNLDIHSVMAMEILEDAKDSGLSDSSGGGSSSATYCPISNELIEARNVEVLKRVEEMQKMVENSEQYLNEHDELIKEECEDILTADYNHVQSRWNIGDSAYSLNPSLGFGAVEFADSDCDSLNSSKLSSNEDVPPPGVLKHSDSLVLLVDAINHDLCNVTEGLNLITCNNNQGSGTGAVSQSESTPKPPRKENSLFQLLSDLQALGHDCSQSESDSESVHTPRTSPTQRRSPETQQRRKNLYRTSFGLHSPDGDCVGIEFKDHHLKEYLRQLKEYSKVKGHGQDLDMAAQKLSKDYGFEVGEETFIETDPDLIDLRAIPPPQTPEELDALSVINAAPRGFENTPNINQFEEGDGELDKFLAKVIIAPPMKKVTPAKELTPEEILSFIIPPPPNLEETEKLNNTEYDYYKEQSLYSNSGEIQAEANGNKDTSNENIKQRSPAHVIEYATVERKGAFSCCAKSKSYDSAISPDFELKALHMTTSMGLALPPKRSSQSENVNPPARPPKSTELQNRYSLKKQISLAPELTCDNISKIDIDSLPPILPPRCGERSLSPVTSVPPKKPHLPAVLARPILRMVQPLPSPGKEIRSGSTSPLKLSSISSPVLHRNINTSSNIGSMFNYTQSSIEQSRSNGQYYFNRDCPSVCVENSDNNKPHFSPLYSSQMSANISNTPMQNDRIINKNGYVIDAEALLAKTDIAMAGLLVRLDQVAAQCTAAQAAGGGSNINEDKFKRTRDELTEKTLSLVTCSKMLVVAMSDMTLMTLPEHLTSCLTLIRRITELTQDMARHTSSPLQTRNIVLKVHDVTSSFRELAQVQIRSLGAGQLALQAECLANVIATLLRSLRVFSP